MKRRPLGGRDPVDLVHSLSHRRYLTSGAKSVFPPCSCFPAGSSSSADMECGGGELSDSGSSGYWSWDHGNVSPAPSPSVTEMDSSPDEGLQVDLEQGDELHAKKPKVHSWRTIASLSRTRDQ